MYVGLIVWHVVAGDDKEVDILEGKVVENVEIVPEKVTATIKLESYSTEVPLKVLTTGILKLAATNYCQE